MILEKKEHIEYHKNGLIWISGTIGIVALPWKHLYDYRTEGQNGQVWCRLGKWTKHYDNGQLAWVLEYDEFGFCIGSPHKSYQRNGTVCAY